MRMRLFMPIAVGLALLLGLPAGAHAADKIKAVNALYLAPPPGNVLCPSTSAAEAASVIDWEPTHPALAGLDDLDRIAGPRV